MANNTKTLAKLFDEVFVAGFNVRIQNLDGYSSWQQYKEKYSNLYIEGYIDGIPIKNSIIDIIKNIYNIDPADQDHLNPNIKIDTLDNRKETDHFYVQHLRLVIMGKGKLSVLKLLQIAYNSGQYRATYFENNETYSRPLVEFYNHNRLSTLETYIESDICEWIPKE